MTAGHEISYPWKECPAIEFDQDVPLHARIEAQRSAVRETASDLLEAVFREVPRSSGLASLIAHIINLRTFGRFSAEARAYAKAGQTDWTRILLAGMAYELMTWGCSTAAIAAEGGPVLARNMDFWPEHELARNTYKIVTRKGGRTVSTVAGWPGALGVVTGLSARGFAIALNAVWSSEGMRRAGYPVLLFLRRVIDEAEGFDHALALLTEQRLMAACLLTLVGTRNEQRVVIERTPSRARLRRPKAEEALVTTNDFRTDIDSAGTAENELVRTSCGRFDALSAFLGEMGLANPSNEVLLFALSDPSVIQTITAQHVIVRPAQHTMDVYVPKRLLRKKPSSTVVPFRVS